MPSSTSPSRAAAIVSGIGSAVAEVFRAFSPPRIFPSDLIGVSPFVQSHVDSTMSVTMDDTTSRAGEEPKETDDAILQMMANDQAEGGDGRESNVGGGRLIYTTQQCCPLSVDLMSISARSTTSNPWCSRRMGATWCSNHLSGLQANVGCAGLFS